MQLRYGFPIRRRDRLSSPPRSGAAAIEMALVLPVLISIIFGTIDVCWIYFVRQSMMFAAREGARELSLQGATVAGATTLTNSYLTAAKITGATVTGQNAYSGNGDSAAVRQVWIQITLPAANAILADPFRLFSAMAPIVVRVTMRKEGQLLPPGSG